VGSGVGQTLRHTLQTCVNLSFSIWRFTQDCISYARVGFSTLRYSERSVTLAVTLPFPLMTTMMWHFTVCLLQQVLPVPFYDAGVFVMVAPPFPVLAGVQACRVISHGEYFYFCHGTALCSIRAGARMIE
jgi:hypothetical protein